MSARGNRRVSVVVVIRVVRRDRARGRRERTVPWSGDAARWALNRRARTRARAARAGAALSGEPGAGKTRLLQELCALADERGHLVLVGRGAEFERDLPFGVWVDALDDHVAALGEDHLAALIGDRVAELARVLPSAAAAEAPLGGLQDERFRAHRAVRALLQQLAARRPVVLVLDDAHWADEASVELMAHLLRRPAPARLLIALAFRTGQLPLPLASALEATARDGSVTELELTPLSRREADSLMGSELPEAARDAVYRRSGGNPFYLQELAAWSGAIHATPARRTAPACRWRSVPRSVRSSPP